MGAQKPTPEPGPRRDLCVSPDGDMEPVQSRSQAAQALVEFGLLLALVAVVSIGSLLLFGATVGDLISTLSHTVFTNINP